MTTVIVTTSSVMNTNSQVPAGDPSVRVACRIATSIASPGSTECEEQHRHDGDVGVPPASTPLPQLRRAATPWRPRCRESCVQEADQICTDSPPWDSDCRFVVRTPNAWRHKQSLVSLGRTTSSETSSTTGSFGLSSRTTSVLSDVDSCDGDMSTRKVMKQVNTSYLDEEGRIQIFCVARIDYSGLPDWSDWEEQNQRFEKAKAFHARQTCRRGHDARECESHDISAVIAALMTSPAYGSGSQSVLALSRCQQRIGLGCKHSMPRGRTERMAIRFKDQEQYQRHVTP